MTREEFTLRQDRIATEHYADFTFDEIYVDQFLGDDYFIARYVKGPNSLYCMTMAVTENGWDFNGAPLEEVILVEHTWEDECLIVAIDKAGIWEEIVKI